jgi:ferredoxin-NADP reductase
VLAPLFLFAVASPPSDHPPMVRVAVNCAVVAFSILSLQFLLMARFRWIEALFGLDAMWLLIHNVIAFAMFGLALVHGLALGDDLAPLSVRMVWISLPLIAWSAWFHHRIARPYMLARRPFKVRTVHREAPGVWTLNLEPPAGNRLDFAPGQFQFLRPLTGSLLAQEHPFTIASSPASDGRISLTIKETGNFTTTIGALSPGDLVSVHGPFGRFSHLFHPHGDDLVFIAAGVGITPLMSMLRSMRHRGEARRVLLIYANREPSAIAFRKELEAIEAGSTPSLKVVHVLSRAPDGWHGLPGRLDAPLVQLICPDLSGKTFFICCPPRMTASLITGLRRAGVNSNRIHAECFGL